MGVVVDDGDPVDLAAHLEAAAGPTEPGETGEHGLRVGAEADHCGEVGGAGVQDVVVTGHREVEHVLDPVVHEHGPGAEVVRAHRADPQVGALVVAVGEHGASGGPRRVGEAPRPVVVVAGDERARRR